jgi:hypothetical protein
MDQALLVGAGRTIVQALDDLGAAPRAALWVHGGDTDNWKLWLVPELNQTDRRRFYRQIAEIVTEHRKELGEIDAADAEMVSEEHPAIDALKRIIKAPNLVSARFTNNQFNGYYLPDAIILRMNL